MKIGTTNLLTLSSTTMVCSDTSLPGFDEDNIVDENTLKVWKVQDCNVTLDININVPPTYIDPYFIALFNVDFETSLTINFYDSFGNIFETVTFARADRVGLDSKNIIYKVIDTSAGIYTIELIFAGGTPTYYTYCGYIWAGNWIDIDCPEKMKALDLSSDDLTVTRANRPDTKRDYNYQQYSVTTKKEFLFLILRDYVVRPLLALGYGNPRPFIFDDPPYYVSEVILGVFDSPKFGYDWFDMGDYGGGQKVIAGQITFGVREVF